MLRSCIAVMAIGCGRIDFDPSDAPTDGTARCAAAPIAGYDLADQTPVAVLVATAVPDGVALGTLKNGGSYLAGVHLDTALVPKTPIPTQTTPAIGDPTIYLAGDLQFDGAMLVGGLFSPTNNRLFLKTFETDMSTFVFFKSLVGRAGHSMFVTVGATSVAVGYDGSDAVLYRLVGSQADGTGILAAAGGPIVSTAAHGLSDRFVVAAERDDGTCVLIGITEDRLNARTISLGACHGPRLARDVAADKLRVLFERDGSILGQAVARDTLPSLMTTDTVTLGSGSEPHAIHDGKFRYAWRDGRTFGLASEVSGALVPAVPDGLPADAPDAWDVAIVNGQAHVFAAYGTQIWSFPICN